MTASEAWFVCLLVDPVRVSGYVEGTSLKVSHMPMGRSEFAMVRDDGQSREAAVLSALETLPVGDRENVRVARVGRVSDLVEVRLGQ